MKNKKLIISIVVALLASVIIFLSFNSFINEMLKDKNNKSNSNSNITSNSNSNDLDIITKKTEIIDFKKYESLRNNDEDTFAIILMKSEDKISNTFKEEILMSFNKRKSVVYELDIDKLDEEDLSQVITDITNIQKYKEPTMITPTMIVIKKGEIVLVQEGLAYSTELNEKLEDKDIE